MVVLYSAKKKLVAEEMEWINQMIYGFETCGQTKLFRPKRFHSELTAHLHKSENATTYLKEKDENGYFL